MVKMTIVLHMAHQVLNFYVYCFELCELLDNAISDVETV
jgi:hypothetical protein